MRLRLALLALALAYACGAAAAQTPGAHQDARPNILLVLADDWSWPHASVYGDPAIRTPHFDRVAAAGMLFSNAFAVAPSCTASRSALLTGQAPHRLDEAANLYGTFPARFKTYPDALEAAGYVVGYAGKGWSPGDWKASGRSRNPAGPEEGRSYPGFATFLRKNRKGAPFCYWMGAHEPHRPYRVRKGETRASVPAGLRVPVFLPDTPFVRQDLADYYGEVAHFDEGLGEVLAALEEAGLTQDTLVVVTSDNGMPFPRAKANVYDAGTRVPLAVAWPGHVKAGSRSDAFVDLSDLAATFLEAAGVAIPPDMTAHSLVGVLKGDPAPERDHVFLERERHADCRPGQKGYPMRAVRTADFLYVRNLRPDLWPAGDPPSYCDIDDQSPSKREFQKRHDRLAGLALDKRPAEELYDLRKDPDQLSNVATSRNYQEAKALLRSRLDAWMQKTNDPRAARDDSRWDDYIYYKGRRSVEEDEPRPGAAAHP